MGQSHRLMVVLMKQSRGESGMTGKSQTTSVNKPKAILEWSLKDLLVALARAKQSLDLTRLYTYV